MNRIAISGTLAAAVWMAVASGASAQAQQPDQSRPQAQQQKQESIFGSQMMSREERDEYRRRMRSAKTPEERTQIRNEHHDQMVARAKERGITLPAEPPAGRPRGPGMGGGMGGGMGPGPMGPGPGGPRQPPG